MAENTDDLLEETADGGEAQESKPKGLSTALLIKVAIGLGVLLIALIVAFFIIPPSGDEGHTASEDFRSQVEPVNQDTAPGTGDAATATSGEIELPPVKGSATAPVAVSEADNTTASSSPSTETSQGTSDKVLTEILALQKQISALQQDNQNLIKQVEQLAAENDRLKTQVSQLTAQRPSLDEVIADEQLVNNTEMPDTYRADRYRNTPQPELAPKWGEFEQLDNN